MTRLIRLPLLAAALLIAAGCDSPTDPVRLVIPTVTLEAAGDSKQLEASVFGSDALPEWESLTPELVTVTRAGMVTAIAAGEARVRARIGSHTAEGTVTVLPPVSVEILTATRQVLASGDTSVSVNVRNTGGRGFFRIEYWRERESGEDLHQPVLRPMIDDAAPVGLQFTAGNTLPGMSGVDWVVIYSREPHSLTYRTTGCVRLDGGSPCPAPL